MANSVSVMSKGSAGKKASERIAEIIFVVCALQRLQRLLPLHFI